MTHLNLVSVGRRSAIPPTGRAALVRPRPTAAPAPAAGSPATVHALPAQTRRVSVADLDEQIAGTLAALAEADRTVDVLTQLLAEKRTVSDALRLEADDLRRHRAGIVAIFGAQDEADR